MKSILLIVIIFLSGCASIAETPKLPLPQELNLPTMVATELECLSDDTYEKLVRRDVMLQGRIKTLRNIIKTTR